MCLFGFLVIHNSNEAALYQLKRSTQLSSKNLHLLHYLELLRDHLLSRMDSNNGSLKVKCEISL